MTLPEDPDAERQEQQAERLAQVRRQRASLLAVVRRQIGNSSEQPVSTAIPEEEKTSSN
jgi:hypothetical protein